jgi:class 3 adenylate cyclase
MILLSEGSPGAIGTVTNLAARLSSEAAGGQILVSASVAGPVETIIDAESVGPLNAEGAGPTGTGLERARVAMSQRAVRGAGQRRGSGPGARRAA